MLAGHENIAGVILAGGRSSRMGENKAELNYNGNRLLDHMVGTLKSAGITNCYVSGYDGGYEYIPDDEQYKGPAHAIRSVMQHLKGHAEKIIFLPVDMPFINDAFVKHLMTFETGGYFNGWPLPVAMMNDEIQNYECNAVRQFLAFQNVPEQTVPKHLQTCLINANTPEEWKRVVAS